MCEAIIPKWEVDLLNPGIDKEWAYYLVSDGPMPNSEIPATRDINAAITAFAVGSDGKYSASYANIIRHKAKMAFESKLFNEPHLLRELISSVQRGSYNEPHPYHICRPFDIPDGFEVKDAVLFFNAFGHRFCFRNSMIYWVEVMGREYLLPASAASNLIDYVLE